MRARMTLELGLLLEMKSLAPSSRHSTSASCSPVMTMTGILRRSGSSFRVRSTSWPLRPGMCRSRSTRETVSLRAAIVSSAWAPSAHSRGVNSSSMIASRMSRFISWSSTIRTSGFTSLRTKLLCSISMLTSHSCCRDALQSVSCPASARVAGCAISNLLHWCRHVQFLAEQRNRPGGC